MRLQAGKRNKILDQGELYSLFFILILFATRLTLPLFIYLNLKSLCNKIN